MRNPPISVVRRAGFSRACDKGSINEVYVWMKRCTIDSRI